MNENTHTTVNATATDAENFTKLVKNNNRKSVSHLIKDLKENFSDHKTMSLENETYQIRVIGFPDESIAVFLVKRAEEATGAIYMDAQPYADITDACITIVKTLRDLSIEPIFYNPPQFRLMLTATSLIVDFLEEESPSADDTILH